MISYIDEHIEPLDKIDTDSIDTIMVGYEFDQACLEYNKEYYKTNTAISIMEHSGSVDSGNGHDLMNIVNTIYDNELGDMGAPIVGYESMMSSVGDMFKKIWQFIYKSIKKLINFIKKIVGNILKFLSKLFGDGKEEEEKVDKLQQMTNAINSEIASGGGGGGTSASSSDGRSDIDNQAEEVNTRVQGALDTNSLENEVLQQLHPLTLLKELSNKYTILTHLSPYYNEYGIGEYISLIEKINNNKYNITKQEMDNLIKPVIGMKDSTLILNVGSLLLLCGGEKIDDNIINNKDIKKQYNDIINELQLVRIKLYKIFNTFHITTKELDIEDSAYNMFLDKIKKDNNIPDTDFIIITGISGNELTYETFKSGLSYPNGYDISMTAINRAAIYDGDGIKNFFYSKFYNDIHYPTPGVKAKSLVYKLDFDTDELITVKDVLRSVSSIMDTYVVMLNHIITVEHTYSVKVNKANSDDHEDYFVNRDTIKTQGISKRILKYQTKIKDSVDYIKTVKLTLFDKTNVINLEKQMSKLDNLLGGSLSKTDSNDKLYNEIVNKLNKLITSYNNEANAINVSYANAAKGYTAITSGLVDTDLKFVEAYSEAIKSSVNT